MTAWQDFAGIVARLSICRRGIGFSQGSSNISERQSSTSDGELARLAAVERYRALDPSSDPVFTGMATLAAAIAGTPMAAVSIVDDQRNWFLGVHGLPPVSDVARLDGLCGSVLAGDIPCMVSDALEDAAAGANRFVRNHAVRFYSCAPIVDGDGHSLGTVAVMDTVVRHPTSQQLEQLEQLAAIVAGQLESRLAAWEAMKSERRLRDAMEAALEDALQDRDTAQQARDAARRDRNDARSDRREAELGHRHARLDRDTAMRDRDVAEHERDLVEQYASVLQRTLLPPLLPSIDGLTMAAHYYPASSRQVGGDFYDVFAVGDDRWAFFIGDVQGHGVEAAVATSLIRYTLRSATLHYRDPADALAELNDVLLRELRPHRFCTVLLGSIDRDVDSGGFRVCLATGGHPAPLLLDASTDSAVPIRSTGGMLVGAVAEASFESCSFRLNPEQTLVLYTDGITEARRGLEPFDERSLAAFLGERAVLDAPQIVGDLATLIPKLHPEDDVAILAVSAR